MTEQIECIILRSISHNERNVIVSGYSDRCGRISFLSPAGNGREARRRRALMMPLGVINCITDSRRGGLLSVRDVSRATGVRDLSLNPMKGIVALFIADLLDALTRDGQPDEVFYRFIRASVVSLGEGGPRATANFHIAFMMGLIRQFGLEPDWSSYRKGYLLDLSDGIFRATPPVHGNFLERDESETAARLAHITIANRKFFLFNHAQRNRIMDVMLAYISIHLGEVRRLKSIEVLRSL